MEISNYARLLAVRAREASLGLLSSQAKQRNNALVCTAGLLKTRQDKIIKANLKDIREARRAGLSNAMLDRLRITSKTIDSMIKGIREIALQKEVIGEIIEKTRRPSGITVSRVRVPIGSILIIYESRPNVTIDSAALCIKSGNSVVLRGGSESFYSNKILCEIMRIALNKADLPLNAVQLVAVKDRHLLNYLLKDTENLDLVIPRGGEGLIRAVTEKSYIPVLKHYKGVCHVYVDDEADYNMAEKIAINAKTQRPAVCNTMETLLINKSFPTAFIKRLLLSLQKENVILFGDAFIRKMIKGIKPARESDWYAEYLDLRLAVRSVKNVKEATEHINHYGSKHTDAIITKNKKKAEFFLKNVDSSSVMWNVSTRFADGGEYGMGAEIGISTDKLHARGPMGTRDMTTYKWVVTGNGQIRT